MRRYSGLALGVVVTLSAVGMAMGQDNGFRGRKYKAPPPVSHVDVSVVRADSGKPVTDASVIFHPIVHGKDRGNMELKTDSDGKAVIDVIETGTTIRLQVIAPSYQTFGQDYKIDKTAMTLLIKLKRPTGQYSIYGNNGQDNGGGQSQNSQGKKDSGGSGQQGSGSQGAGSQGSGSKPNL